MQENLEVLGQLCDYIQEHETPTLQSHFKACQTYANSLPFGRDIHHRFINYASKKGQQDHQKLMIALQIIQAMRGVISKNPECEKVLENLTQRIHSESFSAIIKNYKEDDLSQNSEDAPDAPRDHIFEVLTYLADIPTKNLNPELKEAPLSNLKHQIQEEPNENFTQETNSEAKDDQSNGLSSYTHQRNISYSYEEAKSSPNPEQEAIPEEIKSDESFKDSKEMTQKLRDSDWSESYDKARRDHPSYSLNSSSLRKLEESKEVSHFEYEASSYRSHCFSGCFEEEKWSIPSLSPNEEEKHFSDKSSNSDQIDEVQIIQKEDYVLEPMKPKAVYKGIQNKHNKSVNNCFMIVILQMLFSIPEFTDYLEGHKSGIGLALGNFFTLNFKEIVRNKPFTSQMAKLFETYARSKTRTIKVIKFRQLSEREFHPNHQHDASKYMLHLFESLQNELNPADASYPSSNHTNPVDAWKEYQESHTSIIDELFVGMYETVFKCDLCTFEKEVYEEFKNIPIPIEYGRTGPTIDKFFQDSTETCFSEFECSCCNNQGTCAIIKRVVKTPKYLMLSIQRFDQGFQRKSNDIVLYPNEFSLKEHKGEEIKYSLRAVICHSGDLNCGNYYAYCRRGLNWYYFNDEDAFSCRYEEVDPENAYMLAYEAQI
ncbi:unnamed protein product [Moneuplotes crassus]|uniref:USP domain-containing protein n=1 Tax=Euplotes crassus TaxID=5936 RepID=A0AAD1U0L1_EUPCR|nr:unnamed protein product [Moneuplotes crassus]